MKKKSLFLLCGVPGSGKTTWVKNWMGKNEVGTCAHISRDAIRFALVKEDEEYFSHENEVFNSFIKSINLQIERPEVTTIFVDATHLTEKARNAVLNKLNLRNVDIYPVAFKIPLETCFERNEKRGGRAVVPRGVIRRMFYSFEAPNDNEKYPYKEILEVSE